MARVTDSKIQLALVENAQALFAHHRLTVDQFEALTDGEISGEDQALAASVWRDIYLAKIDAAAPLADRQSALDDEVMAHRLWEATSSIDNRNVMERFAEEIHRFMYALSSPFPAYWPMP